MGHEKYVSEPQRPLISKMAWLEIGEMPWHVNFLNIFGIKEREFIHTFRVQILYQLGLCADNRDLSPYHPDIVTGEGGHRRNGPWTFSFGKNLHFSVYVLMKYCCLVELDWTSTDILKHKRIIFYGIFYLVRNSITFIFFMERDWQNKGLKPSSKCCLLIDPLKSRVSFE